MQIHLDTDLGGDIDDACALAMLLRWPGVDVNAITTSAEEDGRPTRVVTRIDGDSFSRFWIDTVAGMAQT